MNTYLRKIKKNSKALSPVVASIILIAVTVAVSVVVAAWMGGMAVNLMGTAEQASVTNVALTSTSTGVTADVTIQNKGGASVTITSATIDGKTATLPDPFIPIAKGTSDTFQLSSDVTVVDGAQYLIKMQTGKGNTITYSATYNAP